MLLTFVHGSIGRIGKHTGIGSRSRRAYIIITIRVESNTERRFGRISVTFQHVLVIIQFDKR